MFNIYLREKTFLMDKKGEMLWVWSNACLYANHVKNLFAVSSHIRHQETLPTVGSGWSIKMLRANGWAGHTEVGLLGFQGFGIPGRGGETKSGGQGGIVSGSPGQPRSNIELSKY